MHKLLQRQIQRHLGGMAELPDGMRPFLEAVSGAYASADSDRLMVERSLELMSQELGERNAELRQQLAGQQALVRKLEEAHNQLLQSEKLASIGQLAAGVAHEINNPIGFVNSNLGTLAGYIDDFLRLVDAYDEVEEMLPPAHKASLGEIKRQIDLAYLREDVRSLMHESAEGLRRVKQIVQDLKDFSHAGEADWQMADLRKGLDSTLNVVHNEIKYKADVVKDYGALPPVECLSSQLNQVFMNMLVNAAHAVGEQRGTITVRTRHEGENAVIAFSDTGCGIAPENLTRIFDPFFTTKPVGKGTGLGLSLSYSIVAKHRGRIEVESEPGRGTTFRVILPVRQPAAEQEQATGTVAG